MNTRNQSADIDIDRTRRRLPLSETTHVRRRRRPDASRPIDYISDVKEDPDWVREFRHNALEDFPEQADADALGEQGSRSDRLRQHPLLPRAGHAAEALVGRRAGRREAHLRAARHSGAGAQIPRRRRSAVRQRGGLFQHQEGGRRAGRDLCRLDRGAEESPGDFPEMVRQGHPDRRQQIQRAEQRRLQRRLVHLRAAGREGEAPAPGLFPDQRGELRPVRAHAHHRRRRQRS